MPALYQGVLGRGLLCLEVSKTSFLGLPGCAEASLAPAESIAQPRGTGNCCAKASTIAILAAERHCLIPASLSAGACFLLPRLAHAASSRELIPAPSPDRRQAACGTAGHSRSHGTCSGGTCCGSKGSV